MSVPNIGLSNDDLAIIKEHVNSHYISKTYDDGGEQRS